MSDPAGEPVGELIVPLRGRRSELLALQHARWIAAASGASVVPVHHVGIAATDAQVSASIAAVEELVVEAGIDAPVRPLVGGKVSESLVAMLASRPGSVVCMRSKCREPLGQLLWGSVAVEVARRSPVPVLVVGPSVVAPNAPTPVSEIVVAVDGSSASERVIDPSLAFARRTGLRVAVVGVAATGEGGGASPDAAYLEALAARLSTRVPDDRRNGVHLIEAPSAGEGLAALAAERPDAIVAVATTAPVISRRFAAGSVAVDVAAAATAPVFVVGPSVGGGPGRGESSAPDETG